MDVEIIRENGESFRLSDYGVIVSDFVVSSIPIETNYGTIEGRNGVIDYGATYGQREINVPFVSVANDLRDFAELRSKLFQLLAQKESFYIRELRRGNFQAYDFVDQTEEAREDVETVNEVVGDKKYLVRLKNSFKLEQSGVMGESELVFETSELPFAESEPITRSYVTTTFSVVNDGDVPIHPFEQSLNIKISNVVGSTSYLQLENLTNGSVFRVNEGVTSGKVIELDGPTVTSNGLQYLRKTNKGYIELSPSVNNFKISGVTGAKVEFTFPNYYL